MSEGSAAAETRSYGRSAGLLTVALGTAGLLAYAFIAISSHTLDKDDYGTVVVLWSLVFFGASALFRPIEQLLSRTIAEHEEIGEGIGDVLRTAALIQLGVVGATVVLLLALKSTITDELLDGSDTLFWVLVVALAAFGGAFYGRGFLAGRRQFSVYAALLVLEGGSRVLFAIAVAVGIASGVDAVALGIAVAPLASMTVIPFALARRRPAPAPVRAAADGVGPDAGPHFTVSAGGAFAAAVLLMMLSEAVLVSSGALFVRATAGAAAAGFIFNVMMVARAPLLLFQAIATSLLPHLTRLRARGDRTGADAFRLSVNTTLLTIAAFATAVTLGVLAVGPQVMQIAFSSKFQYDRAGLAIVAVGMGFYLAGAALNQAALARGQARPAAVCWVACALGFVAFNLISPLDPFRTVEVGFLACAAVLSGLLLALYVRSVSVSAEALEPGSPREIEARLAAADEIG